MVAMTEICQILFVVAVAYGQEEIRGGRMRGSGVASPKFRGRGKTS